ncbi:hypothetical protein ABH931_007776 [Streptacidiphilus sp. MAP12-33]|uniref:hypothetical protein n=1 Tax=Streptacidiphilus sp. MAP12-33 TaxID=3156266 RepID=UPI0035157FCD
MWPQFAGDLPAHLAGLVAAVRPTDVLVVAGGGAGARAAAAAPLELLLIGPGPGAPGGAAADVAGSGRGEFALASGERARVRFVPSARLTSLAQAPRRTVLAFDVPSMGAELPPLPYRDRLLLHELRTGVVLAGATQAQVLRETLCLDRLPEVLAALHLRRVTDRHHELVSLLAAGDTAAAAWVLRELATQLLPAVLAAAGESDPCRWRQPGLLAAARDRIGAPRAAVLGRLLAAGTDTTAASKITAALEQAQALAAWVRERLPAVTALAPPPPVPRQAPGPVPATHAA